MKSILVAGATTSASCVDNIMAADTSANSVSKDHNLPDDTVGVENNTADASAKSQSTNSKETSLGNGANQKIISSSKEHRALGEDKMQQINVVTVSSESEDKSPLSIGICTQDGEEEETTAVKPGDNSSNDVTSSNDVIERE